MSIIIIMLIPIGDLFREISKVSQKRSLPRRTRKSPVGTPCRGSPTRASFVVCTFTRLERCHFYDGMYDPRRLPAVFITPQQRDVGVLNRGLMPYPSFTN